MVMRQQRVVIENISPQVQCGAFFIKRVVGEAVTVHADILGDGHDIIQAELQFKHQNEKVFQTLRMKELGNDVYTVDFKVLKQGVYTYKIRAWVDHALNWQHGIEAKLKDKQHVKSELLDGLQYLGFLQKKASAKDKTYLKRLEQIFQLDEEYNKATEEAISKRLHALFTEFPSRLLANTSKELSVYVDRKKANFSTWYEFFPRSAADKEGAHGTFKDCERLLPRIEKMGFDVIYLPPIHPIGEVNRKGKNNVTNAEEGDAGVPWAIGSKEGGHKSIHPELGTQEDLESLIQKANKLHIEIALDLAFQAAPDHPYIKEHPEWFRKRPDGTMQYAENPPKKYQDIVNFYFDADAYKSLWQELLEVTMQWVELGIHIFRVDNPHTKPYYFWNWLISEVKKKNPDVLFLAEAFSRPKVMQQLAKQGFSQSYTYFTWRVDKHEITEYMHELTQSEMKEYYRPNFWPNTPDINPYHLQGANEAMHIIRYALAATLSGNLGIYGPVYEYMVSEPMQGKEEYLNSEKYEIRFWDWTIENKITHLISRLNFLRKEHSALQQTNNIRFCEVQNPQLLAFFKWDNAYTDKLLVVINLDSNYSQQGMLQLPSEILNPYEGNGVELHDLITDNHYNWTDEWNFVELHPTLPFHLFHIK